MALSDWEVLQRLGGGGQGEVHKVRHRTSGLIGARKQLRQGGQVRRAERHRFGTEISALFFLQSDGVPKLLDNSVDFATASRGELFLVMEFIDGRSLEELAKEKLPTLDEALIATKRIAQVLNETHAVRINHRDLKHSNVMMRGDRWNDPVLVDFGLAWSGDDETKDYHTRGTEEVGNRFLRLPEFAPGGDQHDSRSDVSMAVGLLFYMLTGSAPSLLLDENGKRPHEREQTKFREDVLTDRRWPKVKRIFNVGFSYQQKHRFPDAAELLIELEKVDSMSETPPNQLEVARQLLRAQFDSTTARELAAAGTEMQRSNRHLAERLTELWNAEGLQRAGQYPVFKDGGRVNSFYFIVSVQGQSEPYVHFSHQIELVNDSLVATWEVDGSGPRVSHKGYVADADGLYGSLMAASENMAAKVMTALARKLEPPATLDPFFVDPKK